MRPGRLWWAVAGLLGVAAVALGAFGAHALAAADADLASRFATASRYHFYHVLALGLALALARDGDALGLRLARWLFLVGMILFSGALYLSALSGGATSTAIAPLGGVLLMAAWLVLGVSLAARTPASEDRSKD